MDGSTKKCKRYSSSYCGLEIDVVFYHTINGVWVPTSVILPDRQLLIDTLRFDELIVFINTIYMVNLFKQTNQFVLEDDSPLNNPYFIENCFLHSLWEPAFNMVVDLLKNVNELYRRSQEYNHEKTEPIETNQLNQDFLIVNNLFTLEYTKVGKLYEITGISGITENQLPVRIWGELASVCYVEHIDGVDCIHLFSTTKHGVKYDRVYRVGHMLPKFLLNECLQIIADVSAYIVALTDKDIG